MRYLCLRFVPVLSVPVCVVLGLARLPAQTPEIAPVSGDPAVPSSPPVSFNPGVAAKIGSTEIPAAELRDFLGSLAPQQRDALSRDPELLKKAVMTFVIQRLVLREALAKSWDQQPQVVAELQRARENTLTQSYLNEISKPPPDFPTADDVQRAYDANKSSMLIPRQYRLAQIFIACPSDAAESVASVAGAKLAAVTKSLQQPGASFSAIARADSDDHVSGAQGGELGWVTENQIQSEIRDQVLALGPHQVSAPVRLKDGWHILQVMEIREPTTPTLDQVRDQLVAQMRAQRSQAICQQYLNQLVQQNPVSLNQPLLPGLLPKN